MSTPGVNTAIVREEPGDASHAFVYLFPRREYRVIAHAYTPDGSEWWQIDRAHFASRSLDSDPWVAADEVSATGDCDAIEITGNIPETRPTATSDRSNNQGAPTATPALSATSVRATLQAMFGGSPAPEIREGLWSLTIRDAVMTCPELTAEIDLEEDISFVIINQSVVSSSLLVSGSFLRRDTTGMYRGQFDLPLEDEVVPAEMSLRRVSETHMIGMLTVVVEDCSIELEIELRHSFELDN